MKHYLLRAAMLLILSGTWAAFAQTQTNELLDINTRYQKGVITKEQAIQEWLMAENKKELDFYGQLVDQHHQPVAGAKVHGGVLLNVSFVKSGGTWHETQTDPQGRFNFLGIHGTRLGMWFEKEGYYYDRKRPSQRPEGYQPDPNKPMVFTIWKTNGAAALIHGDSFYGIEPDGRAYTLDLVERIKIEGRTNAGDLIVEMKRPAKTRPGEHYDWELNLSVNGGGLIEVKQREYMFEAPSSGYEPTWHFAMKASTRVWRENVEKTFFVKSRNGHVYGSLHVDAISTYQDAAAFEIKWSVNPNASRNLEPEKLFELRF